METTSTNFLQSFWSGLLFGLAGLFVTLGISWMSIREREWNLPLVVIGLLPSLVAITVNLFLYGHVIWGSLVTLGIAQSLVFLILGARRRRQQGKPIWNWSEIRQRH